MGQRKQLFAVLRMTLIHRSGSTVHAGRERLIKILKRKKEKKAKGLKIMDRKQRERIIIAAVN